MMCPDLQRVSAGRAGLLILQLALFPDSYTQNSEGNFKVLFLHLFFPTRSYFVDLQGCVEKHILNLDLRTMTTSYTMCKGTLCVPQGSCSLVAHPRAALGGQQGAQWVGYGLSSHTCKMGTIIASTSSRCHEEFLR